MSEIVMQEQIEIDLAWIAALLNSAESVISPDGKIARQGLANLPHRIREAWRALERLELATGVTGASTARHDEQTANVSIEAAIAEFKSKLPGWWFSLGDCSVSADASCGPDIAGPDADLLSLYPDPFDSGFHVDLPQPATISEALRAAMENALAAREEATSTKGQPA